MIFRKIYLAAIAACCSSVVVAQNLSYPITATGQVECYNLKGEVIDTPKKGDDLYGQDGNYKSGVAMSYRDNGDGTVTDLNTGLTWEQTPKAGPVTWAEALEYCENLNLGEYDDWRLPTLKELFSISNFSSGWPYIDTQYFNLSTQGRVDKDEQFWAEEKYVGVTVEGRNNAAFGVNHATGHIKAYPAGGGGARGGEGDRPERPQGGEQGMGEGGQRPPRPEGMQQGGRPQQGDGQEMGERGGQRPARPEGADSLQMAERPRPEGMQQGGRPQGGRQGMGEGGQRPPRHEGADSLQMVERPRPEGMQQGGRPQQGGEQGMGEGGQRPPMGEGQRPQMGEGGQRPQMGGGQEGGAPMMMGNPMQKRVRAVRGNTYGENNYVDNGDGTVTDKATGLMWAKNDNSKGVEWSDAIKYAESSTLAGYSDWRLPNVKELQSIVDYKYSPSSKDFKPAIDPIFSCTPFVNEAGDNDFGYYWSGTSALFRANSPFYFAWYVAFGRAVNNNGMDMHGAGAVRFDSKGDNGTAVEGGEERYYNFVRLVRVTK